MAFNSQTACSPRSATRKSFRETLQIALGLPDDEVVYMAEDDYLYMPNAFEILQNAFAALPTILILMSSLLKLAAPWAILNHCLT